jgi:glyoxylase-like metal-dependent hydrolase (beta-lactamase superfamily II)
MKLGDWTFRTFRDGDFRLDGGAMFGVVPQTMWAKHHKPDEKNRIDMTLRCLLAETRDRRILVDTGIGDRWDDKFKGILALDRRPNQLVQELETAGVTAESVTDVIQTHLHFDHCGGTVSERDGVLSPTFPNARHWIQEKHWRWACSPTERDRASFRIDDFKALEDNNQIEFIDGNVEILPEVRVHQINGHTPGQQMVEFHTSGGVVVFCGDLLPLASQIRVPWIMGYDLNPLLTLQGKKEFLSRAVEDQYTLVFEHDIDIEACEVEFDGKGFKQGRTFKLADD